MSTGPVAVGGHKRSHGDALHLRRALQKAVAPATVQGKAACPARQTGLVGARHRKRAPPGLLTHCRGQAAVEHLVSLEAALAPRCQPAGAQRALARQNLRRVEHGCPAACCSTAVELDLGLRRGVGSTLGEGPRSDGGCARDRQLQLVFHPLHGEEDHQCRR